MAVSNRPPLTLILEPDNPCNTNIIDNDDGRILYQVITEHGNHTITRVRNSFGDVIASWEWRDVRSDILTLGNCEPVSASTWLRKSMVPFKDTVTFQDHRGRQYKWKGNAPGLSLQLYSADDKREPIARFQKSFPILDYSVNPPAQTSQHAPACLTLDTRAEEVQDLVIISFLILEKSRRTLEASTMNRANTMGRENRLI